LEGVIAARAKATQVVVNPTNATAEQIAAFQVAQGELSQALGRLMAISESYPDLKASANFSALQSQLEGTENRITVARNNFNEVARQFNTMIRRFPTNIIANMMNVEKRPYFEANEGAEVAPKVQF
jgi:LemA protein